LTARQTGASLAEVARKTRAKKPAETNGKVYTEDDLSQMKRMGISVVGPEPRKAVRRARPAEPDGDVEPNGEEYWRARAQELLDAIAEADQEIALKKDEIKRFGNGGFDATAGMKQDIARADDRQAQLKDLENHRAELEKQLEELPDEGRKAGAPAAWFR
jgi:chromosome segregation ATPase